MPLWTIYTFLWISIQIIYLRSTQLSAQKIILCREQLRIYTKKVDTIYASLVKEYGVSQTALTRWIKQYSTVETEDGNVLTAKQIKELQKRNAQLEEENLILKKAIAIFTPHSNKD